MAIIKCPDPRYNGYRAGVMFRNGYGETDDEQLIFWFKAHGYKIVPPKVSQTAEDTLAAMSDEGLKQFLLDNGYKKRLGKDATRTKMVKLAKELIDDGGLQ